MPMFSRRIRVIDRRTVLALSGLMLAMILTGSSVQAAEGMWTLDNLPTQRMQAEFGFTPPAALVDRMMRASVRLAGGCSGSFVSSDGLVMTNHHCAAQCIEQLSTAQKNFVNDGFLAKRREEEVRCPGIELNRLEQITDVTAEVKAATAGLEGAAFKQAQNAVQAKLTAACVGNERDTVRCDVVDLYHGGRYDLYRYHRFQDARLVFAPELAIAFFGGDPDNFNFPRYDMDISVLRAYENGKPAVIKDYFPFSKAGAAAGEMVFTLGHPGRTQRQLTMAQLDTVRDVQLIDGLLRLSELRGVLEQYATKSPEAARTAHTLTFGVENSYKALYGQMKALLDPTLIGQKQAEEAALRSFVEADPALRATTGNAWNSIEKAQAAYRNIDIEYQMLVRGRAFGAVYFDYARTLVRAAAERGLPNAERLPEFNDSHLPSVEQQLFSTAPIYPDFEKVLLDFSLTKMRERLGADHPLVMKVLGKQSPEQRTAGLVDQTRLGDVAVRKALWNGGMEAIMKSDDPFIKLAIAVDPEARALRKRYETQVESVEQKNSELIAQARFKRDGLNAYPDATFTLRMSYGEVAGWTEGDKTIAPFTRIGGIFERDTGAFPFALPASWHAAKATLNMAQEFDLVSTNDIIGGNSGSPLVNRRGEIVGLIFDGNIHSLGGAFGYDKRNNRAVAVHSGLLLEAMDKVYHATGLVQEIRASQVR
jgi:hypothetical protein